MGNVTATATAVPNAMTALTTALKASTALAQLPQGPAHVDNGHPNGNPQPPYHVWVPAEVDDWRRQFDLSGDPPSVIEETFRLRIYAVAFVPTDGTFATHIDQATALLDGVAKAVGSDPTLDGTVRLAITANGAMGERFTEHHRIFDSVVWVECQATVCAT